MNPRKASVSLFALATALCSLMAAKYWYLSSKPNAPIPNEIVAPIDDAMPLHVLSARVHSDSIHLAITEASRLNKIAAKWSAWAAAFATIAAILSAF
jgi:hypothetical protein